MLLYRDLRVGAPENDVAASLAVQYETHALQDLHKFLAGNVRGELH